MAKHQFLTDRKAKEFFIVCRIDDYEEYSKSDCHGGFRPGTNYGNKGGYLWPTLKQANDAARHMIEKFPDHQYGVFRLTCIAEREPRIPPVRVTVIG